MIDTMSGSHQEPSCGSCSYWEHQWRIQSNKLTQLEKQLVERDQQLVRLDQDMQQLNAKYVGAIDRVADIQHEKDLVEHDLEDLSCKLFEQANGMVASEKREKCVLETQLQAVRQQLIDEQAQLAELRQRLLETDTRHEKPTNKRLQHASSTQLNGSYDIGGEYDQDDRVESDTWQEGRTQHDLGTFHSQTDSTNASPPMIDQMQLDVFQQFLETASTMLLKKLPQIAYVKHCQSEDVEACLRFGPQSRLSPKRLMNHLLHQSCFIQQRCLKHDDDLEPTPSLWDRWHSSSTLMTCAACGRSCNRELSSFYQFKLNESDPWLPVDPYCRDRLVAVCEFYVFIRNIHSQHYLRRTVEELYSENIRLRLQMFYSRMGVLPHSLNDIGLGAYAVCKACPPLDQDDVSDGSLSNYCPATPK